MESKLTNIIRKGNQYSYILKLCNMRLKLFLSNFLSHDKANELKKKSSTIELFVPPSTKLVGC